MDFGFIFLLIVTLIIMGLGLLGTLLPILPGLPLIWTGFVIFSFFTDFEKISFTVILVFGFLTLLSYFFDYLFQFWGIKKIGASKGGILGAVIGLILGLLTGGLIGAVIGSFLGAFIGELIKSHSQRKAFRASLGVIFGIVSSSLIKFCLGLIMVLFFILKIIID